MVYLPIISVICIALIKSQAAEHSLKLRLCHIRNLDMSPRACAAVAGLHPCSGDLCLIGALGLVARRFSIQELGKGLLLAGHGKYRQVYALDVATRQPHTSRSAGSWPVRPCIWKLYHSALNWEMGSPLSQRR